MASTEREPIMGSGGRAPSGVQGRAHGQGGPVEALPLKLKATKREDRTSKGRGKLVV